MGKLISSAFKRSRVVAFLRDACGTVGHSIIDTISEVGAVMIFACLALYRGVRPPYYPRIWLRQFIDVGYFSLPVVGLTTLFSGMVLAIQSADRFQGELAAISIPNLVVLAITRELAPVLAGLMVSGRIGAAMAAEIGAMRVTEQIDALSTLETDPMRYLVFPRILAATLALPLLVLTGDFIGIFGGFLVATVQLDIPSYLFFEYGQDAFSALGMFAGLIKALVFGFIIALLGCYQGFYASGGAQGVGRSTTRAVVFSSIAILISNYILTIIIFSPHG